MPIEMYDGADCAVCVQDRLCAGSYLIVESASTLSSTTIVFIAQQRFPLIRGLSLQNQHKDGNSQTSDQVEICLVEQDVKRCRGLAKVAIIVRAEGLCWGCDLAA